MPQTEKPSNTPPEPEWARYTGPVRTLVIINALLAFAVEMAMFAFVGWWALALDLPWWARVLVAVAAVGGLIAMWGAFAAPRARFILPTPAVVAVKVFAFACGALALWGLGFPLAAVAFAVLTAANLTVTTYVRLRP
ncbi:YrdB family protein [Glycomyces sp. NPDC048151]|uniref:YrdB family protein n=1 Tax=Glycomyces sp. NPDC048151 TaxID=3364002 RepID=UPI003723FBE1